MSEPASSPVRSALRGQTPAVGTGDDRAAPQQTPPQPAPESPQPDRAAAAENFQLEQSTVAPGMYKPVPEIKIFEWRAPSRPFKKKNRQFFVTVIVIALLISLILFFSGQFLPIAVVISVVFLVYVLQVIPPHDITHTISTYGITIEGNLHYWEELGRFWFDKRDSQLLLNVETIRFPGRLTLLLADEHREMLTEILGDVLLEQKPEPTTFERVARWFQERIPLE